MDKIITLNLEITTQDYESASESLKNQSFVRKYNFIISPFIMFFVFVLLIYLMSDDISMVKVFNTILFSSIPPFIFLIGILVFNAVSPLLSSHNVKKLVNSSPYMEGEVQINFTDEGIEFLRELSSVKLKWLAFFRSIESEREIFLYTSEKDPPIFIPKRAFDSSEDMDFVKNLITTKLGDKTKL